MITWFHFVASSVGMVTFDLRLYDAFDAWPAHAKHMSWPAHAKHMSWPGSTRLHGVDLMTVSSKNLPHIAVVSSSRKFMTLVLIMRLVFLDHSAELSRWRSAVKLWMELVVLHLNELFLRSMYIFKQVVNLNLQWIPHQSLPCQTCVQDVAIKLGDVIFVNSSSGHHWSHLRLL